MAAAQCVRGYVHRAQNYLPTGEISSQYGDGYSKSPALIDANRDALFSSKNGGKPQSLLRMNECKYNAEHKANSQNVGDDSHAP